MVGDLHVLGDSARVEGHSDPAGGQAQGDRFEDDALADIADLLIDVRVVHVADEGDIGGCAGDPAVGGDEAVEDSLDVLVSYLRPRSRPRKAGADFLEAVE